MVIFALYKGDKLIDIGTAKELAKKQGVSIRTIYLYSSTKYRQEAEGKNKKIVIRVED